MSCPHHGTVDIAEDLNRAKSLVADAHSITAMTGAGISTDSGIPDFRGPNGVWTKDPAAERMSNLQDYVSSSGVREQTWQARLQHPGWDAQPNAGHEALVRLERTGRLRAVITQNIDQLHQKAGSDPARTLELHGTMFEAECLSCQSRTGMRETLDRVAAGEVDPRCRLCGGLLKSATISFGQALDADVLGAAKTAAESCDLMITAGTSLTVHPAAGLVGIAANAGAAVIVCNAQETPYDDIANIVLRDPLTDVLPALM